MNLYALRCLLGLFTFGILLSASVSAATDAQAKAIVDSYDAVYSQWEKELSLATDARAIEMIMKKRPDASIYGTKLKNLLRRDLAHEWTLKYGAWLLENDNKLQPESQRALLNAVEKYHMLSPELGHFCLAMVNLRQGAEVPKPGTLPLGSRGMRILETVKKNNPNPKVQGVAALSLSMMLGNLGDDGGVMQRRMTHLKEAIIKSADVEIGNVTVAEIAKSELYKITNLTKGREAPDIQGFDSANRALNLKQFRGQVVMLVFWSSWDTEAKRILEILRNTAKKKAGKPFVVLGVNRDTLANLRLLEADQITTWRNFSDPKQELAKVYRVSTWPYCLVLDQNGVIAYRGAPGSFADAVASDLLLPKAEKATR